MRIENDINLAALGERWRGVARGVENFAFISIGTGLGAGIVLHGELHRGASGSAGELDYARVGLRDEIDPCADALSEYARSVERPRTSMARRGCELSRERRNPRQSLTADRLAKMVTGRWQASSSA